MYERGENILQHTQAMNLPDLRYVTRAMWTELEMFTHAEIHEAAILECKILQHSVGQVPCRKGRKATDNWPGKWPWWQFLSLQGEVKCYEINKQDGERCHDNGTSRQQLMHRHGTPSADRVLAWRRDPFPTWICKLLVTRLGHYLSIALLQ